jgi:hypothetical protein
MTTIQSPLTMAQILMLKFEEKTAKEIYRYGIDLGVDHDKDFDYEATTGLLAETSDEKFLVVFFENRLSILNDAGNQWDMVFGEFDNIA